MALSRMRVFLSRQSDGKTEFLDPTPSSGNFAKKEHAHRKGRTNHKQCQQTAPKMELSWTGTGAA
eukprot:2675721-Prymnesium_polylepis.1